MLGKNPLTASAKRTARAVMPAAPRMPISIGRRAISVSINRATPPTWAPQPVDR